MCLIIVSYGASVDYPLVLAANRDEFYQRPSRPARFWPDSPSVLAGQDVEHGGSWLGLHRDGCFAAVTNYRDGVKEKAAELSRGLLVSDYLQNRLSSIQYLQQCITNINRYNGFNLLVGDLNALYFLSSREQNYRQLRAGTYGICNGDLNSPWPKVKWAKQQLSALIAADHADDHETILGMLGDRQVPDDADLPDTGIGKEWERMLAPVFIQSKEYGTRASTVFTINKDGDARFSERTYDHRGSTGDTLLFEFTVQTSYAI